MYRERDSTSMEASQSRSARVEGATSKPLKVGAPAPYGRACVDCAKSKCKCIIRTIGGACERCHRLNRECRPAPTVRTKHARRSAAFKATQLEQKLDNIVELLKNNNQNGLSTTLSNGQSFHNTSTNSITTSPSSAETLTDSAYNHITTTTSTDNSQENTNPFIPSVSSDSLPFNDGEDCLDDFRTYKSQFLPIVYIPSTTTSEQLFRERPFLWHCIALVSTKDPIRQAELTLKVRTMLSQSLVIEQEANMDLLQGLMVSIAWVNSYVQKKPMLALFTQMANALVFQLGLNKPAGDGPHMPLHACKYPILEPTRPYVRSLEERRTVLGCFLVCSTVSCFLQHIDPLRWTSHMDECVEVLAAANECPNDAMLVQQVRMQLIAEKATHISAQCGEPVIDGAIRTPPALYRSALQNQLRDIERERPSHLKANEIVLLHFHSTTLAINEIGPLKSSTASNQVDLQAVESRYASLHSLKSWLDVFFSIPPSEYSGLSFAVCSQFMRSLSSLFKLSTLDDPLWDKSVARNMADIPSSLRQLLINMRKSTVYDRYAETFEATRAKWESKLATTDINATESVPQATDADIPNMVVDLPEDWWFSDVFTAWDA